MFSWHTAIWIFLIQALGYGVKGLVGFGNPLVATPLLSLFLDSALIPPGTLLLDAPVNAYIAWKNRASFRWRRLLPTIGAVLCGVIPGTLLLKIPFQRGLKILLGLLVLGLGVELATRGRRSAGRDIPWVRYGVAFVSGVCAGIFGINMLIVAYLKRQAASYDEFKGGLCFLFLAENLFRLVVYLAAGLMTPAVLLLAAVSVPAAVAGVAVGGALSSRLPERGLNACAVVMFLLSGASILIKALFFGA
ncbi:MAG: sulfite exporter TauE/SafE family protein [Oscillibacter sp.]|nr:sulfite exporter TauE/SafE family protein [Oscillibacter sp.]